MEGVGLGMEGHHAKGVVEFLGEMYFGSLITVCEKAEEKRPTFPGLEERHCWPVKDPVAVEGTEEEELEAFRYARDEIEGRILDWLERRETSILEQRVENE
jgi:arsenate reductase